MVDQKVLTLPSTSSIRRVVLRFSYKSNNDMLYYLKERRKQLNEYESQQYESTVSLILDEIYEFQTLDYFNGRFIELYSYESLLQLC